MRLITDPPTPFSSLQTIQRYVKRLEKMALYDEPDWVAAIEQARELWAYREKLEKEQRK